MGWEVMVVAQQHDMCEFAKIAGVKVNKGIWGIETGRTASPTRVFCSSESLLKSSLPGIVYCIVRCEDAMASMCYVVVSFGIGLDGCG